MKFAVSSALWAAFLIGGAALIGGCKPVPRKVAENTEPGGAPGSNEPSRSEDFSGAEAFSGTHGDALERLAARLEREAEEDRTVDDGAEEDGGAPHDTKLAIEQLRCPEGMVLLGNPPPKGNSQYCGKKNAFGGGVKNGPFVKWDDNGNKRYEAYFQDDVLNGPTTTYFPSGDVAEHQEYLKGTKSGAWEKWNRNGIKVAEGFFSNGKKNGHFRYWSRHGEPVSEGYFRDDIRSGQWIYYDRDGLIRSKFTFRNGRKDGKAETYYANGRVASAGSYKENKPDGHWIYYNDQGRQTAQGNFVRGRKTGQWTEYDESGRVQSARNYSGSAGRRKDGKAPATARTQSGFVSM